MSDMPLLARVLIVVLIIVFAAWIFAEVVILVNGIK